MEGGFELDDEELFMEDTEFDNQMVQAWAPWAQQGQAWAQWVQECYLGDLEWDQEGQE